MHASSILRRVRSASLTARAGILTASLLALTAGAGFANELPAPAQELFDAIVEDEGDQTVEGDVEDGSFGERVSQDATGASDGVPGVDGHTIACEASAGRAQHCVEDEGDEAGTVEDEVVEDEGDVEDGSFGERVSQDATGESDGVPGVDGEEISEEARARNDRDAAADELDADEDDDASDDEDDDEDDEDDDEDAPAAGRGRGD